ncbi:hypothetical protein CC79DRAFT_1336950 [Sarocladium strictum]
MATTESIIRRTMKVEWKSSWEKAKHGRELFKLGVKPGKATLDLHAGTHRLPLPRCAPARLACEHISPVSTKLTQTNAIAAMAPRPCDTSCWSAGTGQKKDIKCGQANNHGMTLNAFSEARQQQFKQQR